MNVYSICGVDIDIKSTMQSECDMNEIPDLYFMTQG